MIVYRKQNFIISDNLMARTQGAKKVVSDSPGLVDFVIGLVNSVLNLPDGQVMVLSNSNKGIACVAAGPRTRLNHLYSPSAN